MDCVARRRARAGRISRKTTRTTDVQRTIPRLETSVAPDRQAAIRGARSPWSRSHTQRRARPSPERASRPWRAPRSCSTQPMACSIRVRDDPGDFLLDDPRSAVWIRSCRSRARFAYGRHPSRRRVDPQRGAADDTDARAPGGRPGTTRVATVASQPRRIGLDRGRSRPTRSRRRTAADVKRERARRPGRRQHGAAAQVDVERVGRQAIDLPRDPPLRTSPSGQRRGEGDLDLLVRGVSPESCGSAGCHRRLRSR